MASDGFGDRLRVACDANVVLRIGGPINQVRQAGQLQSVEILLSIHLAVQQADRLEGATLQVRHCHLTGHGVSRMSLGCTFGTSQEEKICIFLG